MKTQPSNTQSPRSLTQVAALTGICLGYFMTILDVTAVNVALPAVQHGLHASVASLQWILDGYALAFATLLLSAGSLGDRRGSKGVFLVGLGLFTLASVACGGSPTLAALQAARVVQGIGAALLVPTSLALLRHTFTDSTQRARVFGIYGGIAGIAAAAGPILGGVLTSTAGWRAIFWINVPVGVVALALTAYVVPSVPKRTGSGLDISGQLAGMATLALLTATLIESGIHGWFSAGVIGGLAASLITGMFFVGVERRSNHPMLPPDLFRSSAFSVGNAIGFLVNAGFFGQLFLLNLFFQQYWGKSAQVSGMLLLPEMAMAMLASPLSGRFTSRLGARWPMMVGTAIGGIGLLAMTTTGQDTHYFVLIPMLVATGFGMAFTMPAMTSAVMAAAPGDHAGVAGGVLNAARQSGTVVGVALLGAISNHAAEFIDGFHAAVGLSGVLFLVACAMTAVWMRNGVEAVNGYRHKSV